MGEVQVNGQYRNNETKLGRIISDVMEPDPAHMQTPVFRERMHMLKNTTEGRAKMGDALAKYVEGSNRQLLLDLVRKGALVLKDAAESLSIPEAELQLELAGGRETVE